jgi:hypothetical protein
MLIPAKNSSTEAIRRHSRSLTRCPRPSFLKPLVPVPIMTYQVGEHCDINVFAFESASPEAFVCLQHIPHPFSRPIKAKPHKQSGTDVSHIDVYWIRCYCFEVQNYTEMACLIPAIEEQVPGRPVSVDELYRQRLKFGKSGEQPMPGSLQELCFSRIKCKWDKRPKIQFFDPMFGSWLSGWTPSRCRVRHHP